MAWDVAPGDVIKGTSRLFLTLVTALSASHCQLPPLFVLLPGRHTEGQPQFRLQAVNRVLNVPFPAFLE